LPILQKQKVLGADAQRESVIIINLRGLVKSLDFNPLELL